MALDLAKGLRHHGDDVVVCAAGIDGALRVEAGDVPIVGTVERLSLGSAFVFIRAVRRCVRMQRPDVIVSHLLPLNLLITALVRVGVLRVPVVLVEHSHRSTSFAVSSKRVRSHLQARLMRLCYPSAHAVVGVSHRVTEDVARLVPAARRTLAIPNGVDVERIWVASSATTEASQWVESLSRPRLVAVGRLVEHKRFSDLLRGFAGSAAAETGNLVILGEGPLRPMLESLALELGVEGSVHLVGFVENPWAVMARSDLFVLSSVVEGFGLVVAEAVVCGVRIVSTDCPSGPADILAENPRSLLVPVGDVRSLSGAIDEMLAVGDDLPPAPLSEQYTLQRMAESYRALFVSVLAEEAKPGAV